MNALNEIQKLTGILPKESLKIWEEVKANQAKLKSCSGPHEFDPIGAENKLRMKWKCKLCGGVIDGPAHFWYARGLEHGKSTK